MSWDQSHSRQKRKVACFTLIELLVVVAIIAILASLLLPALSQARNKAKSSICVNKQKQIFMAVALYIDEQDEYRPPNKMSGSVASNTWTIVMLPYLGYTAKRYIETGSYIRAAAGKHYTCPLSTTSLSAMTWWSSDFGVNASTNVYGENGVARKYNDTEYPDRVMDHMDSHARTIRWNTWNTTPLNDAYFRHTLGANVTYFDGHIGHVPATFLAVAQSNAENKKFLNW